MMEQPYVPVSDGPFEPELDRLQGEIRKLIDHMHSFEERFSNEIANAHPEFKKSAVNLVHYLALRQFDLRDLQQRLARLGLSSLGRTEAHVMASVEAVVSIIDKLLGSAPRPNDATAIDFPESARHLAEHTDALFGEPPAGRSVRIMVTLPTEAAENYRLVRDLVAAGMDIARINCGRDSENVWRHMADHVRKAQRETSRNCRISMDLAGSKPRTGSLEPGPEVLRWKPKRDLRGRVVEPARVWLAPEGVAAPIDRACTVSLPVDESWLSRVRLGDEIRVRDARRKKRRLIVVERWGAGVIGESKKTAYVETGTVLKLKSRENPKARRTTRVGRLPAIEVPLLLNEGDTLLLTKSTETSRPRGIEGEALDEPARVSCTLPEILEDVKIGESIKFDDGKIDGVITEIDEHAVHVEITRAGERGRKLRSRRSINFPESRLRKTGMCGKDLDDLDLVFARADVVGLSFVSRPDDVLELHQEMAKHHADKLGIVLKIETTQGFEQLPWLLLAAMRRYPFGVMIARGDLAVECGWERTAEIQEEILWLCEAAHVPVIWATQVLEGLAQKGFPTRAEITDAAMAERAECVMLNKGPYIITAIRTLDDVLRRMQGHQTKKTALLRSLNVSNLFGDQGELMPVN